MLPATSGTERAWIGSGSNPRQDHAIRGAMPFPLRTFALTVRGVDVRARPTSRLAGLSGRQSHHSLFEAGSDQQAERLTPARGLERRHGEVGEFRADGLVIDGVLYTATTRRKVLALNAATGKHIWAFDPAELRPGNQGRRQRGVTYWASGKSQRTLWELALSVRAGRHERQAYPKLWEGRLNPPGRGNRDSRQSGADPDHQYSGNDL